MAIRVEHGQVSDYARLGVLAGKATAAREAAERQAAMDRQVMQIQAQQASQAQAQAHQKEMTEFDAYMDNIRYQSSEAWELEKMELRSRHDFEMVEAKKEMDFQNQMQREQRQQQEQDMKLKALADKAPVEMGGDGYLSEDQYQAGVLKLKSGYAVPQRTGQDFREIEKDYDYYKDIVAGYRRDVDVNPRWGKKISVGVVDKKGKIVREATPAEQQHLTYAEKRLAETQKQLSPQTAQLADSLKQKLPTLNATERVSVQKIIDSGDVNKMYEVLKVLEGK